MENYDYAPFFELSDSIQASGSIEQRLTLCESALQLLPGFVAACLAEDHELPQVINCRDYAPIWYMRLGQWDKAQAYISACISCGAYYPDNGQHELQYLVKYKTAALAVLSYVKENPGCLQKNLYKALAGVADLDCMKQFVRYTPLLRKEPTGKTNALYVAE